MCSLRLSRMRELLSIAMATCDGCWAVPQHLYGVLLCMQTLLHMLACKANQKLPLIPVVLELCIWFHYSIVLKLLHHTSLALKPGKKYSSPNGQFALYAFHIAVRLFMSRVCTAREPSNSVLYLVQCLMVKGSIFY